MLKGRPSSCLVDMLAPGQEHLQKMSFTVDVADKVAFSCQCLLHAYFLLNHQLEGGTSKTTFVILQICVNEKR
jgi:hypothetical protein